MKHTIARYTELEPDGAKRKSTRCHHMTRPGIEPVPADKLRLLTTESSQRVVGTEKGLTSAEKCRGSYRGEDVRKVLVIRNFLKVYVDKSFKVYVPTLGYIHQIWAGWSKPQSQVCQNSGPDPRPYPARRRASPGRAQKPRLGSGLGSSPDQGQYYEIKECL
ncbi:hypothetical protein B0H13DRAFT_1863119 [Mycena leptocephala]|nr:hypothetical protein B0H13DRAFT_1863119 [Mycena leptocephala]